MAYHISSVEPTKGFHPISTSIVHLPPPSSLYQSCLLYLYFTLPPLVFVDTHELTQMGAHYKFSHWGSRDLEKPVHAVTNQPSELLVNVEIPPALEWDEFDGESVHIEVPMHLRYGTPRSTRSKQEHGTDNSGSYEKIQVDWPKAFFLCPSTSQSSCLPCTNEANTTPSASLSAKTSLPSLPAHIFAALPSGKPRTRILIPIPPHPQHTNTSSTLFLPVGDTSDLAFVEPLTVVVILLCFLALLKASWRTARRVRTISDVPNAKDD